VTAREAEATRLNVEFEVLSSGDEAADVARMASLVAAFSVTVTAEVPGSYIDLLTRASQ
jgi:hypothetical protein